MIYIQKEEDGQHYYNLFCKFLNIDLHNCPCILYMRLGIHYYNFLNRFYYSHQYKFLDKNHNSLLQNLNNCRYKNLNTKSGKNQNNHYSMY
ncbi:MAG: hypothetical protein MJ001_00885 [Paludibacteraceae bacterium]|nr:hypothetical protein [Paludibacteraceae bacterium]